MQNIFSKIRGINLSSLNQKDKKTLFFFSANIAERLVRHSLIDSFDIIEIIAHYEDLPIPS